jgi:ubiquinone/menaquinone biosynthesis C-methylase UbiE
MDEHIFDVKHASKLDDPARLIELRPQELLRDVAGIASGDTCIDFGSGTGIFAIPMAELAGKKGKVYAIDNSLEMLAHIRAKNPPVNLTLIQKDVKRTGLNSQIADICVLVFILHEVKESGELIAEAFRLLKPDGRLVIVEWKSDLDSPGPPRKSRISKEQIERLFGQTGLTLESYLDWSQNHYVVVGKQK